MDGKVRQDDIPLVGEVQPLAHDLHSCSPAVDRSARGNVQIVLEPDDHVAGFERNPDAECRQNAGFQKPGQTRSRIRFERAASSNPYDDQERTKKLLLDAFAHEEEVPFSMPQGCYSFGKQFYQLRTEVLYFPVRLCFGTETNMLAVKTYT